MTKQHKPWTQLASVLAAGFVAAAGLTWAGPAGAQGHMRITGEDLPGGEATADTGGIGGMISATIDYISNNTYLNFGPHYLKGIGSSEDLTVHNCTGLCASAFGTGDPTLHDTGAGLGNKFFGGGTIGIFIPGTNHHLAVEVLIAGPLEVPFIVTDRAANESLLAQLCTSQTGKSKSACIKTGLPALGTTIGTLMALPPNLTIVYRPWVDTMIQPYIGIGAIYLYTYDSDITNDILTQGGNEPILYTSKPIGCVAQIGVDIMLPHNLYLNADLRYAGCADIKAIVNDVELGVPNLPSVKPVTIDKISTTVHLEALIYSLNIGYRF